MDELQKLLDTFVLNPNDAISNFKLGKYYESIDQTASAVSYYLRTAERTNDELLQYRSLLLTSNCLEKQGTRNFTVKSMLQRAITVLPNRPEAYYLLSLFHENDIANDGRWFESYLISSLGVEHAKNFDNVLEDVDYPGLFAMKYRKALSGWWCGLQHETKDILLELWQDMTIPSFYRGVIRDDLIRIGAFTTPQLIQHKAPFTKLKEDLSFIQRNYSEAFQDLFVLTATDFKSNGTYLEIGSGDWQYGNNTLLLERDFQWNGISIDVEEEMIRGHNANRSHETLCEDATEIDFDDLLLRYQSKWIDYLQIDCDPSETSFEVLNRIPFDTYNFGVITFEHDHYTDPSSLVREQSREYLEKRGYVLIVGNVSPEMHKRPYEDWYVHPKLLANVSNLQCINRDSVFAASLFLA